MKYYQVWIKAELDQRKEKNPNYSLRSFARSLAMSPSLLSRVCNGSVKLSTKAASIIIARTDMHELDQEKFINSLVEDIREDIDHQVSEERIRANQKY